MTESAPTAATATDSRSVSGPIALSDANRVQPNVPWPREDQDFTPWVAAEVDALGSALGLGPLTVQRTEAQVGKFKADVMAITADGQTVVIENQLTRSDHGHLGQLLTYGAGLDGEHLVWIAPEFTAEHLAAVKAHNDRCESGPDLFAVRVAVHEVGDPRQRVAVFDVVEGPVITSTVVKRLDGLPPAALKEAVKRLHKAGRMPVDTVPRTEFLWRTAAPGGIAWSIVVLKKRVRVEIYWSGDSREFNKAVYDRLYGERGEIGEEWRSHAESGDEPLKWERLDKKIASRVSISRPALRDETDETEFADVVDWIVSRYCALQDVFSKRLADVPSPSDMVDGRLP